ncbi:MAG: hypothetical protein HYS15_01470 [Candidatus Spechtbacteria bacterium]|nr:hypothetical protein [Candidatus Spechtbacteria bacterium]
MGGQSKNIIDLRGAKNFGARMQEKQQTVLPPQKKETTPEEQSSKTAKPLRLKLLVLGSLAILDIAFVSYFVLAQNYLASLLFFLIGTTLALMLILKPKNGKLETQKSRKGEEETLLDIFVKFIGL